jgi:threonine dehydratase
MPEFPTLLDVIAARERIKSHLNRTPLHHYRSLDELVGAEVWVKHENHHVMGAFKVRGALNVIAQLNEEEKSTGVVAASTGNFGQGLAYAAGIFGVESVVVVPEGSNTGKVESMKRLGARIVFHGSAFDEAREYADRLAKEEGRRYIHSANEAGLVPGTGTYTLEIMEDLPDVEVIIVPIGGGSGACGACIVSKALNPKVQVIGVQSDAAPAQYLSWKEGRVVEAPMGTIAEGLATGSGYADTLEIMTELLDDFILVSEAELDTAVVNHLTYTHNLTEHAGAASLAAACKIKDRLAGKKVALIVSGGNITVDQLKSTLARNSSNGSS